MYSWLGIIAITLDRKAENYARQYVRRNPVGSRGKVFLRKLPYRENHCHKLLFNGSVESKIWKTLFSVVLPRLVEFKKKRWSRLSLSKILNINLETPAPPLFWTHHFRKNTGLFCCSVNYPTEYHQYQAKSTPYRVSHKLISKASEGIYKKSTFHQKNSLAGQFAPKFEKLNFYDTVSTSTYWVSET